MQNKPENEEHASSHAPKSDEVVIAELAVLSAIEYDRVRISKAAEMGVQVRTLDDAVKSKRKMLAEQDTQRVGTQLPYAGEINPGDLLSEVASMIRRFIVMDAVQADALALWVAHTYFLDVFDITPIAAINAPERACAKTLCQEVLSKISCNPMLAANISTSAMFRVIELKRPTLFIDEADSFIKSNPDLANMINAGYRRNGYVMRSEVVNDSYEPRQYSVYCAKSIAGISLDRHLPDATLSRAIMITLRRKLPTEKVERMRDAEKGLFDIISSKFVRFACDYAESLRNARPVMPEILNDREQDNWEPLFAIAECAGHAWTQRALAAALTISKSGERPTSKGNELLADIRDVFEAENIEKISSSDLLQKLCALEECPWNTYNHGKPISPRQLAKLLGAYGIHTKTIRIGHSTPKGFEKSQFQEAFSRYLEEPTQSRSDEPGPVCQDEHAEEKGNGNEGGSRIARLWDEVKNVHESNATRQGAGAKDRPD
ncbi:MAG: DUF3631 domain-containing protein [Pseudomonadota bacterium]